MGWSGSWRDTSCIRLSMDMKTTHWRSRRLNGVDESKGYLLKLATDKLVEIDKSGCATGKILTERVIGMEHCIVEIKDWMKMMSMYMVIGIIAVVVLAIASGIIAMSDIGNWVLKIVGG